MIEILKKHISELNQIDKYRKRWLMLSALVVIGVIFVIVDWNLLIEHKLIWQVVAGGLIISVVWWYWTMRVIRILLRQKTEETQVLTELVIFIREASQEIKNLRK